MTQLATEGNVLAPFDMSDDEVMEIGGQSYRMFRGDSKSPASESTFWVEMDDPEWERAIFQANGDVRQQEQRKRTIAQVVMTTGSHHFQAYWVRSDYGRELWQFPLRYDLVEKNWVHRKDVFLGPPEWRPGMHFKVWNDNCIFCHATGGQPGLDTETSLMANTTVGELGIACESCHGPGREHVVKQEAQGHADATTTTDANDASIVNPAKLDHELASEICGSCHSNFLHDDPNVMITGPKFRPGRRLTEFGRFFSPQLETDDDIVSRFWSDGVNRSTGREFMGVKNSPCYKRGEMSCLSCHSMHDSDPDDQLAIRMETNAACLQCHDELGSDIEAHTHHAADSDGSLCYNCHMPYTNYGLFKATRSHQISSPVASSIDHKSRPNACNLCHLDQTLEWTANTLHEWYQQPLPSLQDDEKTVSAWALLALRGDAGQRAIAAWHPRWPEAQRASGTAWLQPILEQIGSDPYAAVRYVANATAKRLSQNNPDDSEIDPALKTRKALGLNAQQSVQEFIESVRARRDDRPIASVE